jgi:glycosyltransferase involved in cell wall biosynthesis
MRVLNVSTEIRHGLACAASLALRGHEVIHVQLGSNFVFEEMKVQLDTGVANVKYVEVPTSSKHAQSYVTKLISEKICNIQSIDVIITMPSAPFYLAYNIARKSHKPLILRVSSVGLFDTFKEAIALFHWYRGALELAPAMKRLIESLTHSNIVIAHSAFAAKFLRRIYPFRKPVLIYPTYAKIMQKDQVNPNTRNWDLEEDLTVLGVTMVGRSGMPARHDKKILEIMYAIAKHNPDINVIVLGSSHTEAQESLNVSSIPTNLKLMGFIYDDALIEQLYKHASLVIAPVFFRGVSNRLIEALFYGKPILTNSYVKEMFPDLEHKRNIFISDEYEKYPHLIRMLLTSRDTLDRLGEGARKTWKEIFSDTIFGFKMETIIKAFDK